MQDTNCLQATRDVRNTSTEIRRIPPNAYEPRRDPKGARTPCLLALSDVGKTSTETRMIPPSVSESTMCNQRRRTRRGKHLNRQLAIAPMGARTPYLLARGNVGRTSAETGKIPPNASRPSIHSRRRRSLKLNLLHLPQYITVRNLNHHHLPQHVIVRNLHHHPPPHHSILRSLQQHHHHHPPQPILQKARNMYKNHQVPLRHV